MLDPFTAVATATAAFNTVKKFVHAGQEFENVVAQMGKWYTGVADFRKGQQMQKRPPIFRKLLAQGSVEEEALNLLIHEKKIMEMEKELRQLLNARFGANTWKELLEMQRKIRAQREQQIYRQAEARQSLINALAIVVVFALGVGVLAAMVWVAVSL